MVGNIFGLAQQIWTKNHFDFWNFASNIVNQIRFKKRGNQNCRFIHFEFGIYSHIKQAGCDYGLWLKFQPWIKYIAEAIAQQINGHHSDHNGQPGKKGDPPRGT